MSHPANNLAKWKVRRLLRRAEGLTYSDVQSLSKEDLIKRSLQYSVINVNQELIFPTSLRLGNGTSTPYHHLHYIPVAVSRKARRF